MTMQAPSPRAAIVAFKGPGSQLTQAERDGLYFLGTSTSPANYWPCEDVIYAVRDVAVADRAAWFALETALAGRADPEAALVLAEGLAAGAPEGQPANQSLGTEADVVAAYAAHLLTHPTRRTRVRALARVIANRETPTAVLAALIAAVEALPAAE